MSGRQPRGDRGGGDRGRGAGDRGRGGGDRGRGGGDRGRRAGDRGRRAGDRGRRAGDRGGRGGRGSPVAMKVFSPDGPVPTPNTQVQNKEDEIAEIARITPDLSDIMPHRPGYGTQGTRVTLWANYFALPLPQDINAMKLFRYSIEASKQDPAKQISEKQVPGKQEPGKQQSAKQLTGRMKKRLVELLIDDHFDAFRKSIATDYKSSFISKSQLLDKYGGPIKDETYDVRYRAEKEEAAAQNAPIFNVRLCEAPTLQMSELLDYLMCKQATGTNRPSEKIIQALDIVVNHSPKSEPTISSIGANKHFDIATPGQESGTLGAGLQARRGFFLSVRAVTSRLLVNIQVKQAAFYQEGPLVNLIKAFGTRDPRKLENFLKGVRVRVTHIVKKNKQGQEIPRIKTIAALATEGDGGGLQKPPKVRRIGGKAAGPREIEFFLYDAPDQPGPSGQSSSGKKGKGKEPSSSGHLVSVYDYFETNYKGSIKDPSLPVVNVGSRRYPSYLPAEVCFVCSGQPSGNKLNSDQTKSMIRFAVRPPAENAESIVENGPRLLGMKPQNPTGTSTPLDFGLTVDPQLITVAGRVLHCPILRYSGKNIQPNFGSWNMESLRFIGKKRLNRWTHLMLEWEGRYTNPFRDEVHFEACIAAFQTKLTDMGMTIGTYFAGFRTTLNSDNMDTKIDEAVDSIVNDKGRPWRDPLPPPDLILVMLPFKDTAMYNRIKLVCDVKLGVRNVCVIAKNFAKVDPQYFANVALKFNLKLGGSNHYLEDAKLGIIAEDRTMVVGIDVTHPSPDSSSTAPSVAGIVASVDRHLAQWPAEICIQRSKQEMVDALNVLLQRRLDQWAKHHKGKFPFPENILVYRDGVSESQYETVLKEELPRLRDACKVKYGNANIPMPRITIIIVGKRHHTRFYATTGQDADLSGNPRNGTVVDRQVTHARNWDFFLQAHSAIQGTARPAHYYVVLDEIFRHRGVQPPFHNAAEVLQDLTHNMCYTFGRASKAVSLTPAAYYADLVCTRARAYLSPLFDATPGNTPTPSVSGAASSNPTADPNDVRIHERVRDTMFYI